MYLLKYLGNIFYNQTLTQLQNNFSLLQDLKFYWPTIVILGFGLMRLILFKTFYDVLLTSLLKGWMANKPCLGFDSGVMLREWKHLKTLIMCWVQHYLVIAVGFFNTFYLALIWLFCCVICFFFHIFAQTILP